MSDFTPSDMPSGITELNGKPYMFDAKGGLKPVDLIKPADKLIDEQVRKIFGFALALSEQVARFKGHTFDDLGDLDAMLAQEYGVKLGGAKGNKTYLTHDGLFKIEIRVSDLMTFGPELQVAKTLIDECLNEWAADSRPEIRAIVTRAFNTDKEGQINRSEIFMLLRLEIEDARWQEAMRAIRDAIRVIGSKTYMRFSKREAFDAGWETITIDLAKA
ncbi:DUF3164 family protein [Thioclava sp.]|uniref:DUF3164 family protein n=1 Tax=Thioclava sp. TaxID=1933450 RepID=UPI003241DFDE